MEITKVTKEDGTMCAQLLNLLKQGKWDLSGPEVTATARTIDWVNHIALLMAKDLKASGTVSAPSSAPPSPPPPPGGMKVKSMGKLPAAAPSKSAPTRKKK
jgi:hypothetical protein